MNRLLIVVVLTALVFCFGQPISASEGKKMKDGLYAKMKTEKGDILLKLYYDKTPLTVINFVGLAEGSLHLGGFDKPSGKPFYDGLTFHRVIANFMIQGGCPLGSGTGGPGYKFGDEFDPSLKHDKAGILSMANAGPGTNGSQFFITHLPTPHLDEKHTVFGHVVKGQDTVDSIRKGDKIEAVEIIRVGRDAEKFKTSQQAFDAAKEKTEADKNKAKNAERKKIKKLIKQRWPQAKKTRTGLYYQVEKKGSGPTPLSGDIVSAHYTGRLLANGKKLDSSRDRNEPIEVPVGYCHLIRGLDEAFIQMQRGEKRTLILPPNLAYGSEGKTGVIPPNAWLVFYIELINFTTPNYPLKSQCSQ